MAGDFTYAVAPPGTTPGGYDGVYTSLSTALTGIAAAHGGAPVDCSTRQETFTIDLHPGDYQDGEALNVVERYTTNLLPADWFQGYYTYFSRIRAAPGYEAKGAYKGGNGQTKFEVTGDYAAPTLLFEGAGIQWNDFFKQWGGVFTDLIIERNDSTTGALFYINEKPHNVNIRRCTLAVAGTGDKVCVNMRWLSDSFTAHDDNSGRMGDVSFCVVYSATTGSDSGTIKTPLRSVADQVSRFINNTIVFEEADRRMISPTRAGPSMIFNNIALCRTGRTDTQWVPIYPQNDSVFDSSVWAYSNWHAHKEVVPPGNATVSKNYTTIGGCGVGVFSDATATSMDLRTTEPLLETDGFSFTDMVYDAAQDTSTYIDGTPLPAQDGTDWPIGAFPPSTGPVPPTFTGTINNQSDVEDSPITPLDITGEFNNGGGANPIYAMQAGTLPTGITLSSAGVFSGTPTTVGTATDLVVRLTTDEGFADSNTFQWEITPATVPTDVLGGDRPFVYNPAGGEVTQGDGQAPVVTGFTVPNTSLTLNIPVTTFTSTDNVGVTHHIITESATPPDPGDANWQTPGYWTTNGYDVGVQGVYNLYAYAKDAADNVSTGVLDTCRVDTEAPVVTGFDIPDTHNTLTIPVNVFTSTDNHTVQGHLITESATPPDPGDAGWKPPGDYQTNGYPVGGDEQSYTLYAWARDVAGNVSTSLNDTCYVQTTTPPQFTGNIPNQTHKTGDVVSLDTSLQFEPGNGTGATYSISAGELPLGLSLNASSGVISGTVEGYFSLTVGNDAGSLYGYQPPTHPTSQFGSMTPATFAGETIYELTANSSTNLVAVNLGASGGVQVPGVTSLEMRYSVHQVTLTWTGTRYEVTDAGLAAAIVADDGVTTDVNIYVDSYLGIVVTLTTSAIPPADSNTFSWTVAPTVTHDIQGGERTFVYTPEGGDAVIRIDNDIDGGSRAFVYTPVGGNVALPKSAEGGEGPFLYTASGGEVLVSKNIAGGSVAFTYLPNGGNVLLPENADVGVPVMAFNRLGPAP